MRKASAATVAAILAIALYFTLVCGFDGLRMLTLPNYGLEDVWRAQSIFAIGSIAGLDPVGLIKLAAFFAAVKIAVACVCGLHIVDRLRCLAGGRADAALLEGALIVVVLLGTVAAGAAAWTSNPGLLGGEVVQLLLAAIAIALCRVERRYGRSVAEADATIEAARVAGLADGAGAFTPWR